MKEPIAIVGLSGIFPKAENVQQYWKNIIGKVDCISDVPLTHWDPADYFDPDPTVEDKTYCKRGGFIPEIKFDPMEFGIPPINLEAIDNSQLLALYGAQQALIDANYWLPTFDYTKTGIILGYSGYGNTTVPLATRLQYPIWKKVFISAGLSEKSAEELTHRIKTAYIPWQENSFPGFLGNVVSGRIANRLNFGGTNCTVDAACASSIAALKLAISELQNHQCDMMISGGVDTNNSLFSYMCFSKTLAASKKQDETPFDESADGMLLAEGIGMVVLKRLSDAEKDNDYIYAVIKGIGSSSDGKDKSIYSTNALGQTKALEIAYNSTDINPDTIGLIEAHATGTRVGDITEINALKAVFAAPTQSRKNKIAIGSVKSQIGHTKSAAGIASVIKVALSLNQQILPATIKLNTIHPNIELTNTPLYINTDVVPWIHTETHPRRAGVSSFGFGGTNFHIILEEYQQKNKSKLSKQQNFISLVFFDKTKEALIEQCKKEIELLKHTCNYYYDLLVHQQSISTIPDNYSRIGFVVESKENAIQLLSAAIQKMQQDTIDSWNLPNIFYRNNAFPINKIVALLPGQGSQYPGMLKQLGLHFALVSESFETLGKNNYINNLHHVAFSKEDSIHQTENAQPLLGIATRTYASILSELNFRPDIVVGHSFGELSALWLAGCINDNDYLKLAAKRGEVMARTLDQNKGAMMVVYAEGDLVSAEIKGFNLVKVVNYNGPHQCVISGETNELKKIGELLGSKGFHTKILAVSQAFHTPFVESAKIDFSKEVMVTPFNKPNIPIINNATSKYYQDNTHEIKNNIINAITNPVYFDKNIELAYQQGANVFIEIGTKKVLSELTKQILKDKDIVTISVGANSPEEEEKTLYSTITQMRVLGIKIKNLPINLWQIKKEKESSESTILLNGASYVSQTTKQKFIDATSTKIQDLSNSSDSDFGNSLEIKREIIELQKLSTKNYMIYLENQSAYLKIIDNLQTTIISNPENKDLCNILKSQIGFLREAQQKEEVQFNSFIQLQTQQAESEHYNSAFNNSQHSEKSDLNNDFLPANATIETNDSQENTYDFEMNFLQIISNSTGYPIESIDINMDLEADLGIDSIKRVEILNQFKQSNINSVEINLAKLGELKTIKAIIEYLKNINIGSKQINNTELKSDIKISQQDLQKIDSSELANKLINIISHSTGYPVEAIEIDMDLEADLGIDSIKRIEIFNQMKQTSPSATSIDISKLGELKSIKEILNYLSKNLKLNDQNNQQQTTSVINETEVKIDIKRFEVTLENLATPDLQHIKFPQNTVCLITGENSSLITLYKKFLKKQGILAIQLTLDDQANKKDDCYYLSNTNDTTIENTIETIKNKYGIIHGVLHIHPKLITINSLSKLINEKDEKWTLLIFGLAKLLSLSIQKIEPSKRPFFIVTTYGDGELGTSTTPFPLLGQALSGLCKSLQKEWQNVFVRYINFNNELDNKQLINLFNDELFDPNLNLAEVAYTKTAKRLHLIAKPAEIQSYSKAEIQINPEEVILVTGGGRGITAACIKQMAEKYQAKYIFLGRTDINQEIPDILRRIKDPDVLKKSIYDYLKTIKNKPSPKQVEDYYKNITSINEINETLNIVRSFGVEAFYISLDITSSKQITKIIDLIQENHGAITGLIHGAGNLADKYIQNKSITDYKDVVDVKVKGLSAILSTINLNKLQFVILFSSVVGFYGNAGQTDYAIANEVLNKISYNFKALLPKCKIVSINWGPWELGMVNPILKSHYEKLGIQVIPEKLGTKFFMEELIYGLPKTQVIIGQQLSTTTDSFPLDIAPIQISREFSPEKDIFLQDHVIGGRAVLPMTFVLDWIINVGINHFQGYQLSHIADFKVFNGVNWDKLNQNKRLYLELKVRENQSLKEKIAIDILITEELHLVQQQTPNYRATLFLTNKNQIINISEMKQHKEQSTEFIVTHEEIYPEMQFHGRSLQLLEGVVDLNLERIVGTLKSHQHKNTPFFDPYLADAALQLINVWAYKLYHLVLVPLSIENIEIKHVESFEMNHIEVYCQKISDSMVQANIIGFNKNNTCVLKFTGVSFFSNSNLAKKYKENSLIEVGSLIN